MNPTTFSLAAESAQLREAARQFSTSGHVRLEQLFTPEAAKRLHRHLSDELGWSRVFNQGDKTWDLGPESIAAMDRDGAAPLMEAVHRRARDEFQFLFDSVRVSDDPADRAARALLLDQLIDELNSPAWLDSFRKVTGCPDITRVDGQATRYLPGHFLTGHDDGVDGKDRVAAYVINLSPVWRTEWGGLLLFHDASGDVIHGLKPCYNAIHLFSVPQQHSVSIVAPFAGAPRLSITGWLRRW